MVSKRVELFCFFIRMTLLELLSRETIDQRKYPNVLCVLSTALYFVSNRILLFTNTQASQLVERSEFLCHLQRTDLL